MDGPWPADSVVFFCPGAVVVEEIGVDDYTPLSKGTGIYRGCTPTTSQVQLWATC